MGSGGCGAGLITGLGLLSVAADEASLKSPSGEAPWVVLDTNVVLSALVFASGVTARLRAAWQAGQCRPLVSSVTAQELVRVLAYPRFRLSPAEQEELLADYLPYAEAVTIPHPPPAVPDCRDPFDLPFLHLAVAGRAAFLVSGDRDLLILDQVDGCRILGPEAFLASVSMPPSP